MKTMQRILSPNLTKRTSVRFYHELSYRHPSPQYTQVLEYIRGDVPLDETSIQVQLVAAPWNPADANAVQGVYPSPYKFTDSSEIVSPKSLLYPERTVAGSSGLGVVMDVPKNTSDFQPGDWVTNALPGMGTLRSYLCVPSEALLKVPHGNELFETYGPALSCLFQLGGTARNMLQFQTDAKIVLQNAGNSGVGCMVRQLARMQGKHVVSLVRRTQEKPFTQQLEEQKDGLLDIMVSQDELMQDKEAVKVMQDLLKERGGSPQLALNAVGGESASVLLKLLGQGGTMVTYGGMSQQPVTISTPQFIFNDLKLCGYWHSLWMVQKDYETKQALIDELVEALRDKKLTLPPCRVVSLAEATTALEWDQSNDPVRHKVIFDLNEYNEFP